MVKVIQRHRGADLRNVSSALLTFKLHELIPHPCFAQSKQIRGFLFGKTKKPLEPLAKYAYSIHYYESLAMPDDAYRGLFLTRSERTIVVTLSYIFVAPLIYAGGKKILQYVYGITTESAREVREERQQRERNNQAQGEENAAGGQ